MEWKFLLEKKKKESVFSCRFVPFGNNWIELNWIKLNVTNTHTHNIRYAVLKNKVGSLYLSYSLLFAIVRPVSSLVRYGYPKIEDLRFNRLPTVLDHCCCYRLHCFSDCYHADGRWRWRWRWRWSNKGSQFVTILSSSLLYIVRVLLRQSQS